MAEATLPCRLAWACARIACSRWCAFVATHLLQCALIASFSSPLILANAASAVMVGNSVFALDATFVTGITDPIAFALAPTAVFFSCTVVALVLQPTLIAGKSSPVLGASALRARVIRSACITARQTALTTKCSRPLVRTLATFAIGIWCRTIRTLPIKGTFITNVPCPFV